LKNISLSHLSVWPREAIEEIWWLLDSVLKRMGKTHLYGNVRLHVGTLIGLLGLGLDWDAAHEISQCWPSP
jgi:hypothetical protein